MKIKIYICKKCGNSDFMLNPKNHGFYCTYCGAWLKWANKDEVNLYNMKEEEDE